MTGRDAPSIMGIPPSVWGTSNHRLGGPPLVPEACARSFSIGIRSYRASSPGFTSKAGRSSANTVALTRSAALVARRRRLRKPFPSCPSASAARTTGHFTFRASASARISRSNSNSRLTRSRGANRRSSSASARGARRGSTVSARKAPVRPAPTIFSSSDLASSTSGVA